MKTIYVKYINPNLVFGNTDGLTEKEIKETCFRVFKCANEAHALDVYANTMCTWSTLLEDDTDVNKWVDDAYEHIKSNDYGWLEQNFT